MAFKIINWKFFKIDKIYNEIGSETVFDGNVKDNLLCSTLKDVLVNELSSLMNCFSNNLSYKFTSDDFDKLIDNTFDKLKENADNESNQKDEGLTM